MTDAGFVNYDREWWHYSLRDEPYPDTFFAAPGRPLVGRLTRRPGSTAAGAIRA